MQTAVECTNVATDGTVCVFAVRIVLCKDVKGEWSQIDVLKEKVEGPNFKTSLACNNYYYKCYRKIVFTCMHFFLITGTNGNTKLHIVAIAISVSIVTALLFVLCTFTQCSIAMSIRSRKRTVENGVEDSRTNQRMYPDHSHCMSASTLERENVHYVPTTYYPGGDRTDETTSRAILANPYADVNFDILSHGSFSTLVTPTESTENIHYS